MIYQLWAKTNPFQSVVTHGIVSGIVAQELVRTFLSPGIKKLLCEGMNLTEENLVEFLGYFVSLHDIGKIHYNFQSSDLDMKQKLYGTELQGMDIPGLVFRHEIESRKAMERIWGEFDEDNDNIFSEILGAHHQGKKTTNQTIKLNKGWIKLQDQFECCMRECFMLNAAFPEVEDSSESVVAAILLGLVILSDWISSGQYFANAESWHPIKNICRQKASEFMEQSGLLQKQHHYGTEFHQLWMNIPKGEERELQTQTEKLFQVEDTKYLLALMEAPMGEGKTEAGIYAALQMARQWGKNGFYVALPTAATANQMLSRMRELLFMHQQTENVKLLHAMAWMVDDQLDKVQAFSTEEEESAVNWLLPVRRGLLAPYAVGTVDQAMMSAMFIKYGVLRLLGLSGKALIVDEVHAYDAYMQNILKRLLEWCKALEIPVVLLSATLPSDKKRELLEIYTKDRIPECYPSITAVDTRGKTHILPIKRVAKHQQYSIQMLPILHQPEQIAQQAVDQVKNGGCLCILLNTVAQAQETYSAIKNKKFDGLLLLFHSRFLAGHRDEIEKRCVLLFGKDKSHRPAKGILVATQVVEQSLDVDFDFFMSSVAPIDLLIQRMGRQFRHGDMPRPIGVKHPQFTVLVPQNGNFESDGYVYPPCLLQQTIHLLENRNEIRVPEDIAQLVADGYDSHKIPRSELDSWIENLVKQSVRGAQADKYKLWPPYKKFRPLAERVDFDDLEHQSYLSAQTRLSEPTVRIALICSEDYERLQLYAQDGKVAVRDAKLAQKVLACSVSIREKSYNAMKEKFALSELVGDKLLVGVKIFAKDNPCFWEDPELGVLWKKEKE